jgi:hypothetical protein
MFKATYLEYANDILNHFKKRETSWFSGEHLGLTVTAMVHGYEFDSRVFLKKIMDKMNHLMA